MEWVVSVNGVRIRLTDERWRHIVSARDELAGRYDEVLGAIEEPDLVLRGHGGALIAVKGLGRRKYLLVVYREVSFRDGFVITAYAASRINRSRMVWRRER